MNKKLSKILVLLAATVSLLSVSPSGAAELSAIPPDEAGAKAALEKSPRHHEWVDIALPGGETRLTAFVAYPERKDKAPSVIVIQEIYGLTDWIRAVADRLAADGFIAIAPDLLSGKGPGGGGTKAFGSRDDVVQAVRELSAPEVVRMLDAVRRYATGLPAATAKVATVGFCWGGAQSFHYATMQPDLNAAVVYYGTSPPQEALETIRAAVLGLYGEDDARVNTTVGPAVEQMQALGKTFLTHTYKGAGHGFLRAQADRDGANLEAARQAWPATIAHLRKTLE
jgi:carboxymethylenebutenolidase